MERRDEASFDGDAWREGANYASAGQSLAALLKAALAREGAGGERVDRICSAVEGYLSAERERRWRWLAFMVHELRNSLNALAGVVWLLRETAPGAQGLEVADRMVHRLEGSIAAVLEIDRRTEEGEPPRPAGSPLCDTRPRARDGARVLTSP